MSSSQIQKRKKFNNDNLPFNLKKTSLEMKEMNKKDKKEDDNERSYFNNSFNKKESTTLKDSPNNNTYNAKNNLIIAKIETIYSSIKETEPYYSRIAHKTRFFLIFFTIILNLILCVFKNKPVNNIYCWDTFQMSFVVCNSTYNCSKHGQGKNTVFYLTKSTSDIPNEDILTELEAVNKEYAAYFLLDQKLYYQINYDDTEIGETVIEFFNAKVYIAQNEEWYYIYSFRDYCRYENNAVLLCLFGVLAFITTPIIFGYLADVIGRKKVLLFLLFFQSLACVLLYFYYDIVTSVEKDYYNSNLDKMYDFTNSTFFTNFVEKQNLDIFSENVYLNKYGEINLKYQSQKEVELTNNKYKVFLFICYYILGSCFVNVPISLAYTLEYSLHDAHIYDHYYKYFSGIPIGYFLYLFLTLLHDIKYVYLIIGGSIFIFMIYFAIFLRESPRYLFEYRDYSTMTQVLEATITKHSYIKDIVHINSSNISNNISSNNVTGNLINNLNNIENNSNNNANNANNASNFKEIMINPFNKFYTDTATKQILFKSEINKSHECDKDSICTAIFRTNNFCMGLRKKIDLLKLTNKTKGFYLFKKSELIVHFPLLCILILNTKNLKNNMKIIVSITMIMSFLFFLAYLNIFTYDFLTRDFVYRNYLFNHSFSYVFIVIFISFTLYSFILKFLDYSYVLLINFLGIFIFSFILGIKTLAIPTYDDLNTQFFASNVIEVEKHGNFTITMKMFIMFFSSGQFYCLFFILLRYTQTIYRCTFLCFCFMIIMLMLMFSFALISYFSKNILYLTVVSTLGLVNLYFLSDPNEMSIINEYTKLELSE